jgi:hypothetical protein
VYEQELDRSHHGRPEIIHRIHTGRPGRPAVRIDPDFLRWAYTLRSTSSIARFLNVNRQTVRNALLEYGIAAPQINPFNHNIVLAQDFSVEESDMDLGHSITETAGEHTLDDILDPVQPMEDRTISQQTVSFTGPLSGITDSDLDEIITALRQHFTRAGLAMLDGMLRNLGHRIPRQRIREALIRIDPVHRVFDRIRIRRRVYSVPGPNSLWHHDGQHGK